VNSAVSVCCGVRVEPTFAPSALTSLNSAVYFADVIAGGGPGRNCVGDVIVSGVTWLSHGSKNGAFAGGVGRHTPGAGAWSNVTGAFRPSFARSAMKWAAAASPYAMPCSFAGPSLTPPREAASCVSSLPFEAGK
jgi:hypothetical protein